MLELPPLSLYVHIPWCIKKCPYCDFNSHEVKDSIQEKPYLAALLDDFESDSSYLQGRPLNSVFIGGGTPSLLPASFYSELLEGINRLADFHQEIELTLEANPGTAEANRFKEYRSVGINRLSIGVQSFDDNALSSLGRIHDSNQARKAIELCQQAGFDNFNLDLMFGLPGQSSREAMSDIQTALTFNPPHLSWYQLTIEPNTEFYKFPPRLPVEDEIVAMQTEGLKCLEDAGLKRYETSAYALPPHQSRHNLNYWTFGDYIGIGAGAHSKVTLLEEEHLIRTRKIRQPQGYLDSSANRVAEKTVVGNQELSLEFMMNALRLMDGFTGDLFESRTGNSFSEIRKKIRYLQSQDLLQIDDNRVYPTAKGRLFVNSLLEEFL